MSGEVNGTNPDKPKVLIVIANPATSTTLGIPVGFPTAPTSLPTKTMTGFVNVEEQFADEWASKQVMPWRIGRFKPFAVRDGRLITGQQQYSGAEVAPLVVEALGT